MGTLALAASSANAAFIQPDLASASTFYANGGGDTRGPDQAIQSTSPAYFDGGSHSATCG